MNNVGEFLSYFATKNKYNRSINCKDCAEVLGKNPSLQYSICTNCQYDCLVEDNRIGIRSKTGESFFPSSDQTVQRQYSTFSLISLSLLIFVLVSIPTFRLQTPPEVVFNSVHRYMENELLTVVVIVHPFFYTRTSEVW